MNKTLSTLAFIAIVSVCGYAQQKEKDSIKVNKLEEVVISDTKFPLSKDKSGKVITTISQEDIQKKAGQSLASILSTVAGIEINGNQSANGKNFGTYIRGGNNQQVLIILDGVPVTDASGINFEYDLRLLPIDQIESIEIMKGAASTLYGSGAATGIINIKLKKATTKNIEARAYVNIGSNNTASNSNVNAQDFNQGFSLNGTLNKFTYMASLNSTETNGMSQIAESTPGLNYDFDRFSRLNYTTKLGYKFSNHFLIDALGQFNKIYNGYDFPFDNTGTNDTPFNKTKSEQYQIGFSPKVYFENGEIILNTTYSKTQRMYDEWNSYTTTVDHSTYEARSVNMDLYSKYKLNKELFLVGGFHYQFHDMKTDTPYSSLESESTKFIMLDPYLTANYNSTFGLNVIAGGRLNHHSAYGNQWVYTINPSYHFKTNIPLKIVSSISTAYVTPSLYQLYSEYGNTSLTPEKDCTIETGFEIQLVSKKISLNTVGFYREQSNTIGFDASYHYANIAGNNNAKGIEVNTLFQINSKIKLNANYTFTQVEEQLNRLIPKHKINVLLDYTATNRLFFNTSYQYVDARNDAYYDGTLYAVVPTKLAAYKLFNFLTRYVVIKDRLTVFGTVTNIFNEDFVENIGYSTRGRNFKVGIDLVF